MRFPFGWIEQGPFQTSHLNHDRGKAFSTGEGEAGCNYLGLAAFVRSLQPSRYVFSSSL